MQDTSSPTTSIMLATQRTRTRSPPPSASMQTNSRGHSHRPSISKGMSWLSRGSGSNANQYAPSKPMRISEPKFTHNLDILHPPRSGVLGQGAQVCRTPQEALSAKFYPEEEEMEHQVNSQYAEVETYQPAPLSPIPPTPVEKDIPLKPISTTPPPTRAPPALPIASTSSLPDVLRSIEDHASSSLTSIPPPPPFDPILVGLPPASAIEPFKIIVSLETGTTTHRTTLSTLTSRPESHLAKYLISLLPKADGDADAASIHSHASDIESTPDNSFNSIFHQHLASAGLLSQASSSIHIFLDRPSDPYTHIMTYLRTPTSSPAVLPLAIQVLPSNPVSPIRLQTLLELRNEAIYLALDELVQLCTFEIDREVQAHDQVLANRESGFSHTHVGSVGSGGSVKSVHTFREQPSTPARLQVPELDSNIDSQQPSPASVYSTSTHRDTIVSHKSAPQERDSVATSYTDDEPEPAPEPLRSTTAMSSHSAKHMRSQSQMSRHGKTNSAGISVRSPGLPATPPPGWI